MKTYDKIVFPNDKDIQDRDKAIIELYDALKLHIKDHPVAKKYEEFVAMSRTIYGM
jgi:DNA anti-recombination protein RmuC